MVVGCRTVMAWELANEPRCAADDVRNLPRSDGCTVELMTEWIDEMSTYIKSLDENHLVTGAGRAASKSSRTIVGMMAATLTMSSR